MGKVFCSMFYVAHTPRISVQRIQIETEGVYILWNYAAKSVRQDAAWPVHARYGLPMA